MRSLEDIKKEHDERANRRNAFLQAADKEGVEMIRLEGMIQLLSEDESVNQPSIESETKVEPKTKTE